MANADLPGATPAPHASWLDRVDRGKLLAGSIAMLILGIFILGYTVVTWHEPTTCGNQTMYEDDLCLITEVDRGGRAPSERQELLRESDFPRIPTVADRDWENVQPGDKLTVMTSPWELLRSTENVRTFDEQRDSNGRAQRGSLFAAAFSLAAAGAFFFSWYQLRK